MSETEPHAAQRAVTWGYRLAIGIAVFCCIPRFLGWLAQPQRFFAGLISSLPSAAVIGVSGWRDG